MSTISNKRHLPASSALQQSMDKIDYVDSFSKTVIDEHNAISATDMARAFFSSAPRWVDALFELRNRAVSVFGLKTPGNSERREEKLKNCQFKVGDQLGLFKVFHRSQNEIIIGEDDKHLDFRISLLCEPEEQTRKRLSISTTVKFNNTFGKVYFFPVKPFHRLIVPAMMRSLVNNLNNK